MSSGPNKSTQQGGNSNSQSGDKAPAASKDIKDDSAAATNSPKKDVGMLEEDDEFEEFPAEDWGPGDEEGGEDPDGVNVWEDNWDDDIVEDDFSKQLRAELTKQGFQGVQVPAIRPDND